MKQIFLFLLAITVTTNSLNFSQTKENKNTALLIIDIQNDYFENGSMRLTGSEQASMNAKLILEKFRTSKLQVIHIQHAALNPNATFFLPNTKGAEINSNVKPLENEKVIVKHYPNSFRETELLSYLKEKHITDLVICGMMTHMCVDATVRAAKDLGFTITLIDDACATRDLEINGEKVNAAEVQKAFWAALNFTYAGIVTTKQYLEK
jgi:nicotinamidase-related amidase